MKLKDTLLMPKTNFAMKASLHVKEPEIQKRWHELDVYQNILDKNEGKPSFNFVDGPPYANGNLHTGHAFNKVLKDTILRFKNMNGYRAEVIWGWDTHGLPIENALLKNKKIKRNELSDSEFRELCAKYANEQVENQKEQFFRLGILEGNKRIYKTLDKDFEAEQVKIFAKMVEKKLIYKGLKPVYWSYSSQTALAESEIEYQDVKSPAIYVSIDVIDEKFSNTKVIIWTTTPWTLPANNGISVNAELMYSLVDTGESNYIIASNLVEDVCETLNIESYSIVKEVEGSELERVKVAHPIFEDRQEIIMLGDHVTDDSGTGCVHTSAAHGEEDFKVSKSYGIEPISAMDSLGKMTAATGKYEGVFYQDANKLITEDLKEKGNLLLLYFFTHSAPHDWRSKKPVVYRATEQWFADIAPIKKGMLESVDKVKYINEAAHSRLYDMINNREEWCISRQRKWGVPIPIIYDESDEPIFDKEVFEHISNLFEEHGSNIWYSKTANELLPEGYRNVNSPNNIYRKEMDIMDVWFDSGSVNQAVGKRRLNFYPADIYFEGSDQYRGWFNSSMIIGYIMDETAPFKQLLSHGFVLDGKGNKMSKSLGNTIEPSKIINSRGADILRLWANSVDYQNDVRISDDIINQVTETYRRFRNTIRFMLGNLGEFSEENLVDIKDLTKFDKYMMIRLDELSKDVISAYNDYSFKNVTDLINNYITTELSAFYLDYIKDVTYIKLVDDETRSHILTVLYYHLDQLLILMAPILTHTTFEAYEMFKNEVVFYKDMQPLSIDYDEQVVKYASEFFEFRKAVNKAIEDLRESKEIGKSFEISITINPTDAGQEIFDYFEDLDLYLIVSNVTFTTEKVEGYSTNLASFNVSKFEGIECERCRKYFDASDIVNIRLEEDEHNICKECKEIVDAL